MLCRRHTIMADLLLFCVFVIGCTLSNSTLAPGLPELQLSLGLHALYRFIFRVLIVEALLRCCCCCSCLITPAHHNTNFWYHECCSVSTKGLICAHVEHTRACFTCGQVGHHCANCGAYATVANSLSHRTAFISLCCMVKFQVYPISWTSACT